jgi:translocator protein
MEAPMNTFRPDLPLAASRVLGATTAALLAVAAALLLGALAPPGSDFAALRKPTWQPALYTLQLGWIAAHLLFGSCLALVLREYPSRGRRRALALLAAQYLLLLAWPALLFAADLIRLAFLAACLLWLASLAAVSAAAQVRPLAGGLQVPLFGWVSFMLVLNGVVVALNAP